MNWDDDRCEDLRVLWSDGLPASQIARTLGTTRNAVIGKAWRMGLPKRGNLGTEARRRMGRMTRRGARW